MSVNPGLTVLSGAGKSTLGVGIQPLFFDHAFYCKTCGAMAPEFSRPEVAAVLVDDAKEPAVASAAT